MFQFLSKLFSAWTRQAAAADRAADTMEAIADDLASFRERMRSGLGLDAVPPAALPAPSLEANGEPAQKGNGRKAKRLATAKE